MAKRWKQKTEYGKKKFGTRGKGIVRQNGKQYKLTYFYTTEQWEAARKSTGFQQWAKSRQLPPPKKVIINIEPRPVMHLAQQEVNPKVPRLWDVAAKQVSNPTSGYGKSPGAKYAKAKGRQW